MEHLSTYPHTHTYRGGLRTSVIFHMRVRFPIRPDESKHSPPPAFPTDSLTMEIPNEDIIRFLYSRAPNKYAHAGSSRGGCLHFAAACLLHAWRNPAHACTFACAWCMCICMSTLRCKVRFGCMGCGMAGMAGLQGFFSWDPCVAFLFGLRGWYGGTCQEN